nr:PREDICTED: sphingomyelin phosphodiesterase 3 isoform X1 [Lepisosteus oculatus]XP_015213134.1 PREDICTED: sphingomyelin phosphodiesterase 3 isoform X1 [Lepisosteus oculatus]XP_015213135.1 PREDICTED: sphingomyelin phosphodiesterase 3 isoform X1 [Lepisosteus oculatus]XP_015213136.1 PREDICTED: sphingomyelin phosphodiesterase 3 isoform X1 [Lepisosteus oculatus]
MALRESPFSNQFVAGLHSVAWWLIFPCFWFLDRLIAVCISTTFEKRLRYEQECYLNPLRVFFGAILFLCLFLITAPIALLGFVLWVPLQAARRPFSYHRQRVTTREDQVDGDWALGRSGGSFGFVTANLCLLPDSLARFNNLSQTQVRSRLIGQLIIQGVTRPADLPSSTTQENMHCLLTPTHPSYGATESQPPSSPLNAEKRTAVRDTNVHTKDVIIDVREDTDPTSADSLVMHEDSSQSCPSGGRTSQKSKGLDDIPWEVSALFPVNVDFVLLEEAFDRRAARRLKDILSPFFGHVLYDVGLYGFQGCSSFKFFNSGIFFASRYPILEASFHCFPNGRGEDSLASKGVLSVKVLVGQTQRLKNAVGFFNCTHLHAPEDDGPIRYEQLDMLSKWISEFQAQTKKEDEIVVFDVLCGDFNFDNCSPRALDSKLQGPGSGNPVDALEQKHSLFDSYKDPCRAGPGKEKPWVIGTLLEQPTLYDDAVSTPKRMKMSVESEEVRKRFIAPPVAPKGCVLEYPEPGAPWVGRRIDYVLYREATVSRHLRTEVEKITFVTQFAGLTDHIPVGMRLRVSVDTEEPDV